jgi:hypothetical protein
MLSASHYDTDDLTESTSTNDKDQFDRYGLPVQIP